MASAPIKPWEATLNSSGNSAIPSFDGATTSGISSTSQIGSPPVPPPRLNPRIVSNITTTSNVSPMYNSYSGGYGMSYGMNSAMNSYGGYGGFSGGYGGYGGYGSGYGGYGGYGSYGSGYGMGGYGGYGGSFQPGVENRFIQLAEESSRPTFQSIESIVRTFGSMAAMLDQTFFAMTSSFRAVLSVADSFGRLRAMMQQMWTSFALFKAINWILRKLMSLLRIYDSKKLQEAELNDAFSSAVTNAVPAATTPSKWPIAIFLGVIISAPYIVSKMIGQAANESVNEETNVTFRRVSAAYGFTARQNPELSFTSGETLLIYPDEIQQRNGLVRSGWVLAKNLRGQQGVVPVNFLFDKNKINNLNPSTDNVSSNT